MNSNKKHTIHSVDFKIEGFLKTVSESLSNMVSNMVLAQRGLKNV